MKIIKRKRLLLGVVSASMIALTLAVVTFAVGKARDSFADGEQSGTMDPIGGSVSDDCLPSCSTSGGSGTSGSGTSGSGTSGSGTSGSGNSGTGSSASGANPTNSIIKYIQNTTDNVSNMPTVSYCNNTSEMCSFSVASNIPTRTGYTFKGWSTTSNGAVIEPSGFAWEAFTYSSSDQKYVKNLYAIWEQNSNSGTSGTGTSGSGTSGSGTSGSGTSGSGTSGNSGTGNSGTSGSNDSDDSGNDTSNEDEGEDEEETDVYIKGSGVNLMQYLRFGSEHVTDVMVDGNPLSPEHYELDDVEDTGEGVFIIHGSYLDTLDDGEHVVKIVFDSGEFDEYPLTVKTNGSEDDESESENEDGLAVPNTGGYESDNNGAFITIGIAPILFVAGASLILMKRKDTHRKFD